MAGEFGSPYREPCGGWPSPRKWYLSNHTRNAHKVIEVWNNTTKVADYRNTSDPEYSASGIVPYLRKDTGASWPIGDLQYAPRHCPGDIGVPYPNCDPTATFIPKCGPWREYPGDTPDGVFACPEADETHGTRDHNCYVESDPLTTEDRSECLKIGFKNVQAYKVWHGRFGFLSHDPGGAYDAECDGNGYETEHPTPDSTKYLTWKADGTYFMVDNDDPVNNTFSVHNVRQVSVNRYSGVLTLDSCSNTYGGTGGWGFTDVPLAGIIHATGLYNRARPTYVQDAIDAEALGDDIEITEEHTNTRYYCNVKKFGLIGGTRSVYESLEMEVTLSNPYTSANLYDDVKTLLSKWDLSNDAIYPWRHDGWVSVAPLVTYCENGVGNPDYIPPCDTELNDHNSEIALCVYNGNAWTDPNAPHFDGSIRGEPNPAGYASHFSWDHRTWRGCEGDNGTTPYIHSHGAFSAQPNDSDQTDWVMPQSATQWTENAADHRGSATLFNVAADMGGGGWLYHRAGIGLYAQKWAETYVRRPSHNFFRPCDADRFLLDETKVACVVTASGSPATLTVNPGLSGITTGTHCLVYGVTGVTDGVYSVTRNSDTSYTLSTFIGACPTRTDGGTGIFGKIRWPSAWAICGRVAVASAVQSGSDVVITTASSTHLRVGDAVDFAGISGLGSNVSVTEATSATEFKVVGTLSGAYAGGGYVSSYSAPNYKWHDDNSKSEFISVAWGHNFRDYQERDRVIALQVTLSNMGGECAEVDLEAGPAIRTYQASSGMPRSVNSLTITNGCAGFSSCSPFVLAVTPTDEFNNDSTQLFPESFTADDRYGAMWQAAFVQNIADPFWQAPHRKCVECPEETPDFKFSVCSNIEQFGASDDSGTCDPEDLCVEDCIDPGVTQPIYYAQRPWVEARSGLPAISAETAPTPPSPITFHYLTLAELDSATPPDGNMLAPPTGLGWEDLTDGTSVLVPTQAQTPWMLFLNEQYCVCNNGRFAATYQTYRVLC